MLGHHRNGCPELLIKSTCGVDFASFTALVFFTGTTASRITSTNMAYELCRRHVSNCAQGFCLFTDLSIYYTLFLLLLQVQIYYSLLLFCCSCLSKYILYTYWATTSSLNFVTCTPQLLSLLIPNPVQHLGRGGIT